MNILLVTMSMDIGGAETHILELAKELQKRGNEVFLISSGGKLIAKLNECGVKHIYAPLKDKKINHIFTSLKIIKNAIKENKIDVVHAHARIPGFICGIACKKCHVRFVTTVHGIYKINMIYKLLTNWGEKTLAVSEDIRKQVIKDYKLKPENVKVTVNGIDVNKFKKDIHSLENFEKEIGVIRDSKRLVHVSRLDKDSSTIAEMLIGMAEMLNKEKIQLIIVGSGNKFEELKEKAESLKNANILMLGSRTDVNVILNVADIFVGVSRAALEAMATEIPVILAGNESYGQGYQGIFDETKLQQSLETNFCCRGLPNVQKNELYNDILKLSKLENIAQIGKYNRSVVEKYYSVDKMVNDCIELYGKS